MSKQILKTMKTKAKRKITDSVVYNMLSVLHYQIEVLQVRRFSMTGFLQEAGISSAGKYISALRKLRIVENDGSKRASKWNWIGHSPTPHMAKRVNDMVSKIQSSYYRRKKSEKEKKPNRAAFEIDRPKNGGWGSPYVLMEEALKKPAKLKDIESKKVSRMIETDVKTNKEECKEKVELTILWGLFKYTRKANK